MSQQSTTISYSNHWEDVCHRVELVDTDTILKEGYRNVGSHRSKAIVEYVSDDQFRVYGYQSPDYSLVSNRLIQSAVEEALTNYQLDVRYTDHGEYSFNLMLPKQVTIDGEVLSSNIIINNSYNGRAPISFQGTVLEHFEEQKMRVSYYRQICKNGLMGWVDEFLTMDEYLQWLVSGKPKKYRDALKVKQPELVTIQTTQERKRLHRKWSHIGINPEAFRQYVVNVLAALSKPKDYTFTTELYERLAASKPRQSPGIILLAPELGLPKKLAGEALKRLEEEQKLLNKEPNFWLMYNAVNYALFNSKSSLTITERYKTDEETLHYLAELTVN